ncbi:37S ribosomal protein NAM9, mitochondrial [Wickerhamomyces ciferrii]|uniref:Small ribosomal subunit protein uS4m n=1 Tax=Wickerhamomyces ciferrii (strain ATCC 14091 / BCRC 22168 / CBS 111 / JCM 3599 / NBRC 0793 / NRRL Y-1031 F-60-10) TaxID=1206466 RepID=K0KHY9_WICCF|nr:37S ribosomal protein NAM9, mitochondrial [Wickerhamomyces ciferrii]CCH40758.1 37S ribosomal protein NAM9, mitochondrial [Wickerhamomyces ciferrii]
MPRRAELLHSLTRGRIRTSWNKHNLFNLYKKSRISFQSKNLYQQKWTAKQETRAYHGEHLTEGRWKHFFSQKLESVAQLDASLRGEQSADTPVLLQTYAVLEKRLDFALFRAMFASSVRQARQFILHGNVFVNDVKITQPNYQLKAGDVFHVKPEKVLEALGSTKPGLKKSIDVTKFQIIQWNDYVKRAKAQPLQVWKEMQQKRKNDLNEEEKLATKLRIQEINKTNETKMLNAQRSSSNLPETLTTILTTGLSQDQSTISMDTFKHLYSNDALKHSLNLYNKLIQFPKLNLEKLKNQPYQEVKNLMTIILASSKTSKNPIEKKQISEIRQITASVQNSHMEDLRLNFEAGKLDPNSNNLPYDPKWAEKLKYHEKINFNELKEDEIKLNKSIKLPFQSGLFGRFENKKKYFTPWKIRPFIAPFAILPAHIEISFETCHAVYMRDPVAYPGYSEVISPFDLSVHERAYMWYVNRVKRKRD